jgi:hypothetical protein
MLLDETIVALDQQRAPDGATKQKVEKAQVRDDGVLAIDA